MSHSFDDINLTVTTGLVPIMSLTHNAGLFDLANDRLSVSTGADRGTHPAAKLSTFIGGMAASANSIDDLSIVRHGGVRDLFEHVYAPSTLGSFLGLFAFGYVRQLETASGPISMGTHLYCPLGHVSFIGATTSKVC